MTKEKLLKYFNNYLKNEYCVLVDTRIEMEKIGHPLKEEICKNAQDRYDILKDIYQLLKKID
jgi:hypothetical protein